MATKTQSKPKYSDKPANVSPEDIVYVRNGFNGTLTYISTRTGETYVWDSFGDEVEMDIRELRTAKGAQKGFFENNWFMFDYEFSWVIPYLGVTKYYDNSVSIEDLPKVLKKKPTEVKKICENMPRGQKLSFVYMVREKYRNGEIDSLKTVAALEEGLGITLSER